MNEYEAFKMMFGLEVPVDSSSYTYCGRTHVALTIRDAFMLLKQVLKTHESDVKTPVVKENIDLYFIQETSLNDLFSYIVYQRTEFGSEIVAKFINNDRAKYFCDQMNNQNH